MTARTRDEILREMVSHVTDMTAVQAPSEDGQITIRFQSHAGPQTYVWWITPDDGEYQQAWTIDDYRSAYALGGHWIGVTIGPKAIDPIDFRLSDIPFSDATWVVLSDFADKMANWLEQHDFSAID